MQLGTKHSPEAIEKMRQARIARPREPEVNRFSRRFEVTDDGCWSWTGHVTPEGYGRFYYNDRLGHAHRYAYEEAVGEIPVGLTIDHLCRNRRCVNPDHLEPVTHGENNRRGDTGGHHWQAQITHCSHGHEYTEENSYWYRKPGYPERSCRSCRTCKREQLRRWRERQRG